MKDFFKKLMGFALGPIVGAMISFITVPVTARLVSADQFGLSNMFVIANNIITLIVLVGIDQAFIREYNETTDRKKLLYNSLIVPFIATTIIGIILIVFKSQFAQLLFNNKLIVKPIILLAICIPLFIVENFMLSSLRMQEKAMKYSLACIGSKVLNLVLTLIFLCCYKRNFESIIYATIFSQLTMSVILLYVCRGYISISKSNFDKKQIITLLKYGVPLLPATLIGWGLNSMDSIFLRTMSTYTELGYYSVALKVSNILGIVQTSFTTFWTPVAFKWRAQKEKNERFELVSNSVLLIMSLVFILILLFKNLIPLIFGQEYDKIIYILPFLMFYPIFYTISETTALGISFAKKTVYNILVSAVSIIINAILNYILIPIYGAIGAAFATGFSYIVFFWIKTLISRKLWYKFKIKEFILVTVILLTISILNVVVKDMLTITIINVIALVIVLVIFRKLLIKLFKQIKIKGKNIN